jgi:hypothetical protein
MPALSFNGMMPSVRPMLPWIALTLSLSLNLFFVAGLHPAAVSVNEAAAPPIDRDKLLAEQMKLNENQREAYQFYRQQLRDLTGAARVENQDDSDAYWDELASASPNLDTLKTRLVRLNQRRTDMQIKQTAATIEFLSLLDPAQRAILIDATHRQQDKASLHPHGRKPDDISKPVNEGPKP